MFIAALSSLPALTSAVHRKKHGENKTRKEVEFNKRLDGQTDPVEDGRFDCRGCRQKARVETDGKLIGESSAAQQDGDHAL